MNILKEKIRFGTSKETADAFKQMAKRFAFARQWVMKNTRRTDKSLTLFNFFLAAENYLKTAATNIDGHIAVLALVTRGLYEINLQARDSLSSDESLRRWHGELVTDKIEVIEGILGLDTVDGMETQREALKIEVSLLKSMREKYNLSDEKPLSAGNIAKTVGLSKEHSALFKLFSKLVHPSSYLVNDYKGASSHENRMILQVHAQIYAWDTFHSLCEAALVPKSVRERLETR